MDPITTGIKTTTINIIELFYHLEKFTSVFPKNS